MSSACTSDNPQALSLRERLALARLWLLGTELTPLQLRHMGADPWQLHPPASQRMQAAVGACLRELADHLEQHGVELGLAQSLLLDQVLHNEAQ